MSMTVRTLRRCAAWLVLALLCAQWATASYACPQLASAGSAEAAMPEMPGCGGMMPRASMDPDQPQLCKAHCEHGSQTAQPAPADAPSPSLVLWAVLDWHAQSLRPVHGAGVRAAALEAPAPSGSPPLYLRLLVLRN